jgi:hypothetical protein
VNLHVEAVHVEILQVAAVDDLPRAAAVPPMEGLRLQRSDGACGTPFSAVLDWPTGSASGRTAPRRVHVAAGNR